MFERTNIHYPLWRKKMDSSMFNYKVTTLPKSTWDMWEIEKRYKNVTSQRDVKSKVTIVFNSDKYEGWITKKKTHDTYRLWLDHDLLREIKSKFLMSYMRDLEERLRKVRCGDLEKEIPFWEFLDIEFDYKNKTFYFYGHYTQVPLFPDLFNSLIKSPKIKEIDNLNSDNPKTKIYKQDWKPIDEFDTELGATNVIYMLLNKKDKRLYIGEAKDFTDRYNTKELKKKWEFYRYDKLPEELRDYRVLVERMLIRMYSSIMNSKNNILTHKLSNYTLINTKIDK